MLGHTALSQEPISSLSADQPGPIVFRAPLVARYNPRRAPPSFIAPNLVLTQAAPVVTPFFGSAQDTLRRRNRALADFITPNLILAPPLPAPLLGSAQDTLRRRTTAPQTFIAPNLILAPPLPAPLLGSAQDTLRRRATAPKDTQYPNIVLTFAQPVVTPFASSAQETLRARRRAPTDAQAPNLVLNTTPPPADVVVYRSPLIARYKVYRAPQPFIAPNILLLKPTQFMVHLWGLLPPPRRVLAPQPPRNYLLGPLDVAPPQDPFKQTDWPTLRRPLFRPAQFIPPNLALTASTPVPTLFTNYDWATPNLRRLIKRAPEFIPPNLVLTAQQPAAQAPFFQTDWPTPRPPVRTKAQVTAPNLVLVPTAPPILAPFFQTDWPTPRRVRPVAQAFDPPNLLLFLVSTVVPTEPRLPTPGFCPAPEGTRSNIQDESRPLAASEGSRSNIQSPSSRRC